MIWNEIVKSMCLWNVYSTCMHKCHIYIAYATRNVRCMCLHMRYINTGLKYIFIYYISTEEWVRVRLTGVLYGFQYVLGELSDYVASRVITRHYHAGTIPFRHCDAHFGRVFPDNLREVTCEVEEMFAIIFHELFGRKFKLQFIS